MQPVRSSLIAASFLLAWGATADPSPMTRSRRHAKLAPTGLYAAYLDGRFALAHSDPDKAAEAFLRALALDPSSVELQRRAFLACLLSGRPEALTLARQLPDDPAAQLLLADRDAKSGSWEAAEQRYRSLPRQGVTQVLQPLLVAWAQQGAGHTEAALNTLRPHVEGPRFRGAYALHAALIADLGGRQGEAGRLYRAAQAEYGGLNVRLAQILASWQARQGRAAEALGTLKSLASGAQEMSIALPSLAATLTARPVARATDGIAEAYLAMAAALNASDPTDLAMPMLRMALDLRPDLTAARLLIADIHEAGHDPTGALRILATVPAGDSLYALVQLRRAALQDQVGRTDEAMAALEQIAREHPDSPLPLAQEGDMLRAKSRFAEAIAVYDRAIERLSDQSRASWTVYYARGIAEERSQQWDKAEADFKQALRLAPDQPYVLNYLGYSWADQGKNLAEAGRMLQRAAALRPNDGSIVDSLGWVMLRQGETAQAVRLLEQAAEISPEDATINGHLGDAYWAAGRKLEAGYQWRRALTLNPDPDDAAKLEAKLHEAPGSVVAGPATPEHSLQ